MANDYTSKHDFVLLDGVRGLGAVMILIGHTMQFWGPFWAPTGAIVVDAFFLLSGFVIAYATEPRLAAGVRVSEFILFRLIRLYPLYLLGTLLGFAVLVGGAIGDSDAGQRINVLGLQLLPQLFFLPAPEFLGGERAFSMNGPAWTLFFELIVNIAYGVFFRFLTTRMLMVVVAVCAVALATTILLVGSIDMGMGWHNFWGGLARASFGFFAGVLVFRLAGSPKTAERPPTRKALFLLFSLPLACFMPVDEATRPFVEIALVIGMGMPLLYVAQSMAPPVRLARFLHIGARISFALYILHAPLVVLLRRIEWRYPEITDYAPLTGIAILIFMLLAAYAAEKYYDRPVRAWAMRVMKKWRASMRVNAAPTGSVTAPPSPHRSTGPRR